MILYAKKLCRKSSVLNKLNTLSSLCNGGIALFTIDFSIHVHIRNDSSIMGQFAGLPGLSGTLDAGGEFRTSFLKTL